MSDLVEANDHSVSYFESYGAQATQTSIIGQLLKFSKGDWLAGQENVELKPGTQLVAVMDQLSIGWIKWEDNRPSEQMMGLVIEGFKPHTRKELGDNDSDLWDVDNQGKPRDPWQFTNTLILRPLDATSDDDLYTFSTSSRGGIGAVGELCKAYGKMMRQKPNEYPIIELGVNSYNHPNKEYGRIKVPAFTVVGWAPKDPTKPATKKIK